MPRVRKELKALHEECESLCRRAKWLGHETSRPNFRLLYSSIESYECGSGFAVLGLNPAGDGKDADTDDLERPFRDPGYSAYLDDKWRKSDTGEASLQRVVQALAMVIVGATPREAMEAMEAIRDPRLVPEEHIGEKAVAFLRNTVCLNIIPFRESNITRLPHCLREQGEQIGWRLLCLAQPRLRCIISLVNQVEGPPWKTILKNSRQRRKPDYEEPINSELHRNYREVELVQGPLAGSLIIGLPAVVRDKGRADVTKPLLDVVKARLGHHGLIYGKDLAPRCE